MKKIFYILLILSTAAVILYTAAERVFPLKYYEEIIAASQKYDIDPAVIFAIAKAESNFRDNAVSKKGAVGVMQVMPSTAKWYMKTKKERYHKDELYDYKRNIDIGAGYFGYLYDDFKDEETAIAAYNAGPNRVKENGWSNIGETKRYVRKVKIYTKVYKVLLKVRKIFNFEKNNDK